MPCEWGEKIDPKDLEKIECSQCNVIYEFDKMFIAWEKVRGGDFVCPRCKMKKIVQDTKMDLFAKK